MALKSELEENPFEPPIDDDFLKTALEYRDNFESYKFEVTAEVSEYGAVSNIRVRKVY